jgi:hypothetical protein
MRKWPLFARIVVIPQHSQLATGAAMLKAARSEGITWVVVRTWPGGHALERKLKNRKNHKQL